MVLWILILLGALVSVVLTILFISGNPASHLLKSFVFMIRISLNIILFYSLDHPFKGF